VRVSGPSAVAPNTTASFTATAEYSDGSSRDATAEAKWTFAATGFSLGLSYPRMSFPSPGVANAASPRGEGDVVASVGGTTGRYHVFVLEPGTFRVNGTVSTLEQAALSDVTVTVDVVSGIGEGLRAMVHGGRFALYGVAGPVRLRASAEGFAPEVHEIAVTSHDMTAAFGLRPEAAPAATYTLAIDAGSGCSAMPDVTRMRQYTATIRWPTEGSAVVTLSDASFSPACKGAANLGCDQFLVFRNRDLLQFEIYSADEDSAGGAIWEHMPNGALLQITGTPAGRFTENTITATGKGGLWYCPNGRVPCGAFVSCRSDEMRLTFTRR
jgi:hypothetical protein